MKFNFKMKVKKIKNINLKEIKFKRLNKSYLIGNKMILF